MDTKQEALAVADWLDRDLGKWKSAETAVTILRRQHARIEELTEALELVRLFVADGTATAEIADRALLKKD